jgi:Holliday junction DNA helicase RuvB
MPGYETMTVQDQGAVRLLRLNRPRLRNPADRAGCAEMIRALEEAEAAVQEALGAKANMVKRILEAIIVRFGGGRVGLSSRAVAVGEEPDTLEEVYEPYLILQGYLNRTPQGRVATEASFNKLGLKSLNKGGQQKLL